MRIALAKSLCILITIISVLGICTACSSDGIDGKWVAYKVTLADGTEYDSKDLGITETYKFKDGKASYSCTGDIGGASEITLELDVTAISDSRYDLSIDGISCCEVELIDGQLVSTVGEGEDAKTYYFKKKLF